MTVPALPDHGFVGAQVPGLSFVSWTTAGDTATSRIVELAIADPDGAGGAEPMLYSTTRYGGALGAWRIDATGVTLVETASTGRLDAAGSVAGFDLIAAGSGVAILTGGGVGGALRRIGLDATGFGGASAQGTVTLPGDLIGGVTVGLTAGGQVVYGGLLGAAGIGAISLTANGVLSDARVIADTATAYADRVVALTTGRVGDAQYLFTACATGNGVTAWQIGTTGNLREAASLGAAQGLWIAQATAMATAELDGKTWLILAAAGSSTLTVANVDATGTMTVTDHVIDDLTTRFGGVAAMTTVAHQGQIYVLAGGADDGITLLTLMPDGRLLALATIADTMTMGLDNVSAIAARSTATGIEVFVASGSEAGITRLFVATGPAPAQGELAAGSGYLTGTDGMDVLHGTAASELISGGAGDDVLIDGDGSDTLTGGAGADYFVLTADGTPDRITDFTQGQDRIDLTAWGMLRDVSQLTLAATATGFRIDFGAEVLIVDTVSGQSLNPATLTNADLIGLTRIAVVAPDPEPIAGTDAADILTGGSGADTIRALGGNDSVSGLTGDDLLYGGAGNDTLIGGGGRDTIYGDEGNDVIRGDTGDDALYGGSYHDLLDGGDGNDSLWGGSGLNTLFGGAGHDVLYGGMAPDLIEGGDGNDYIWGSVGRDTLRGGAGDDTFFGGAGNDLIEGGEGADIINADAGNDQIFGGEGNDTINGGYDNDLIRGDAGDDALYGGEWHDTIHGGDGNDSLWGGTGFNQLFGDAGNDWLYGSMSADTLDGGADDDRLYGGAGNDHLSGGTGSDLVMAGSGNDLVFGGDGADTLQGEAGDDTINGGDGDDILTGGAGADQLAGQGGRDVFVWRSAAESPGGAIRDLILDFVSGEDRIDLSAIDANPHVGGNQAFVFIDDAEFGGLGAGSAGQVRFSALSPMQGMVEVDTDGNGVADMQIVLDLITHMRTEDFIL